MKKGNKMYISSFHKKILKDIDREKVVNMASFFEHYINNKNQYRESSLDVPYKYDNFTVQKGYLVPPDKEKEVSILFDEFISLLRFLEINELISTSTDKQGTYVWVLKSVKKRNELFTDILDKQTNFVQKKIIKRKGFENFKKLGYRTPAEAAARWSRKTTIITIFISIVSIIITILLSILTNTVTVLFKLLDHT